ncbi:MAG: sigma-70 family RNA polymerase sigma factor [Rhodoblastus sp.]
MSTSAPKTDSERADLIADIAERGDRSAFIALFEFYAPRIKGQAMRFGLSADMAEDVAQDAMLAVWRRAGQFDAARGSASAWIFTIATNARTDRLRRDRRLTSAVELDADSIALSVDAADGASLDAARVSSYVQSLPEQQRHILHLSFFRDLPHAEIARTLDIPLGTVKSRIRLAISKLRQAMKDEA